MKSFTITVIKGDGIGPDVIDETIRLLQYLPVRFNFTFSEAGYAAYKKFKTPLPADTIQQCKRSDAILFGAVTTPPHIPGYVSPIVTLRKTFNLYANIRPFFSLPVPGIQKNIDIILVRENTEGLYSGLETTTPQGAIAKRVITKKACMQIMLYAFKLATLQKRKKVTVVHKANILRITDGLFLDIAYSIARKYPNIPVQDMLIDSCAMQIIKNPQQFDVIVTTNMFGDILSDEIAALTGGLGTAASANIGKQNALFEPVHGSAPKYAGTNTANPIACFFAACMMLDYLKESKQSDRIKKSILNVLQGGILTKDLGGNTSMTAFTDRVIKNLKTYL